MEPCWHLSTTAHGDPQHGYEATGHWLDIRVPAWVWRLAARYGVWQAHRAARRMGVSC